MLNSQCDSINPKLAVCVVGDVMVDFVILVLGDEVELDEQCELKLPSDDERLAGTADRQDRG